MKEKIAKVILHVLSIILFIISIKGILEYKLQLTYWLSFCYAVIINPICIKKMSKGLHTKEPSYLVIIFVPLIVISLVISTLLPSLFIGTKTSINEYNGMVKILLYVLVLFILFLYTDFNRKKKFIIFGIVYIIFNAIYISNETIVKLLSDILKCSSNDIMFYCENILSPIKEGILTYIIFETIIEYKKKIEKNDIENNDINNYENKKNECKKDEGNVVKNATIMLEELNSLKKEYLKRNSNIETISKDLYNLLYSFRNQKELHILKITIEGIIKQDTNIEKSNITIKDLGYILVTLLLASNTFIFKLSSDKFINISNIEFIVLLLTVIFGVVGLLLVIIPICKKHLGKYAKQKTYFELCLSILNKYF
ncbi:hypothetical protein [Anaeromicropila herbilytica]|uniref:Uncharacterized protein n=1 Tax=Anaeromicropila herbilytica TaxID=2785025 RepID=A0A7R7ENK1_9FIRM|nr:hypothetical protein [Anaeromicropila herbilytica]BCN32097.1 hypothetical protein bsdtb5_33920 [Anaeromicropila herbilytica]